jgi:hypothetical protein
MRKFVRLLVVMALLVTVAPVSEQAFSKQKGAGVAGGGRISRGKNDSAARRATEASNEEEVAAPRSSPSARRDSE